MKEENWNQNLEQMMEAGVHFGHQARKWNPKIAPYLLKDTKKIRIIHITHTARLLADACDFATNAAREGKQFLLVGTRYQTAGLVATAANKARCHYVNTKWLGGMLTNWSTIKTRLQKFEQLEAQEMSGTFNHLPKKEVAVMKRQLSQLRKYFHGIKYMKKVPDIVIFINQHQDYTAIQECIKLGIPTIGLVDTDCDPNLVDMPIPANDDNRTSIRWILNQLTKAIIEGRSSNLKTYY